MTCGFYDINCFCKSLFPINSTFLLRPFLSSCFPPLPKSQAFREIASSKEFQRTLGNIHKQGLALLFGWMELVSQLTNVPWRIVGWKTLGLSFLTRPPFLRDIRSLSRGTVTSEWVLSIPGPDSVQKMQPMFIGQSFNRILVRWPGRFSGKNCGLVFGCKDFCLFWILWPMCCFRDGC